MQAAAAAAVVAVVSFFNWPQTNAVSRCLDKINQMRHAGIKHDTLQRRDDAGACIARAYIQARRVGHVAGHDHMAIGYVMHAAGGVQPRLHAIGMHLAAGFDGAVVVGRIECLVMWPAG